MKRALAFLGVLGAAAAILGRRYEPVRAAGESMMPIIAPGDLLAVRPLRAGEPVHGQVVVAHSRGIDVVKRVVATPGEGELQSDEYWLEGDFAQRSTDSRTLGPVKRSDITRVVRACYWPPRRVRLFSNRGEFPTVRRRPGGARGSLS